MKKAIVLFNLGGPDNLDNVEPFLFNLFNDPAILNLPKLIRYPLAKFISNRRAPIARKIYQEIGGSSPILKLTKDQANSLQNSLNSKQNSTEYKAFIAMRCWHPRASETMQEVKKFNPNEIILLPLYPQYSAATSGSSFLEWENLANKNNLNINTNFIFQISNIFILIIISHMGLFKHIYLKIIMENHLYWEKGILEDMQ